jgi:hypothetical protein
MSLNDNKAVKAAYENRVYVDGLGARWRRGMDGWFRDMGDGDVYLIRHEEMVKVIEEENPED